MAGRTVDPKPKRITLRLSTRDLRLVRREASSRERSVGVVIRSLIREYLPRARARSR